MDEDDFGVVLTKSDYQVMQAHKKQNQIQKKQIKRLKQQNSNLDENFKQIKKSLMVKEQQLKYISQILEDWMKSFKEKDNGFTQISENSQSVYENLFDINSKGLNTIELLELQTVWANKYKQITQMMDNIVLSEQSRKTLVKKSKVKNGQKEQNGELIKIIEQMNVDLLTLKQQNCKIKKKNKSLVDKINVLEVKNKVKKDDTQKSYAIKLLIDEYYADLQRNLAEMKGIKRNQIETVIFNEMQGINVYISTLMKKMKTN